MVSHSCSGKNSFVDITSNQAQPLSNFLLIQPDQRHLQILIEVQLEDYSPPPLPNPPNLANEGGKTLLYQQGNRLRAVWTWVTKLNTSRLLELRWTCTAANNLSTWSSTTSGRCSTSQWAQNQHVCCFLIFTQKRLICCFYIVIFLTGSALKVLSVGDGKIPTKKWK